MPELEHCKRSSDPASLWAALDRDGGVIVDDFIAAERLERLRTELFPLVERHQPGPVTGPSFWREFHGDATKRITGLAARSPAWVELLCDPLYRELGDRYLGDGNYYLNTGQLICIGPGETRQMLHRDELNWPKAVDPEQEITITAIFALTDFTEANGATVIAPGTHRDPDAPLEAPPESCCRASMRAGGALLYSGKVIHGGGANETTDQWRVGLHAGFVVGWLRAEENHQLTTPLTAARGFPEHVQHLLGFRSFEQPMGGRLGMVDYEDAAKLLDA